MSAPAQTHNMDKVKRVAHAPPDSAGDDEKQSQQQQQLMELTIISEPAMLAQAAVGIDWTAELVDAQSSLFRYAAEPLQSTLTVPRSSTLVDLAPLIEEVYRIPAARQEFWLVLHRSETEIMRARTRLEPRGQHAGWSIEQISLDPTDANEPPRSGPLLVFLRDTNADPRPQPQETSSSVFAPGGRKREAGKDSAFSGSRAHNLQPSHNSASSPPPVTSVTVIRRAPAPGVLVTANSLLILFKLFDVPSQTMLYLGSAHFALTEPVQAIRQYCAELVALRSKEQTPTGEMLRFSLSYLLDEDDEPVASSRLTASDVWSCMEVSGSDALFFPFNFFRRSREIDAQRLGCCLGTDTRFKEAPDWNAITTESCKIQNGEIALFHLRYKPEQLQWLRQRYEQQRQEWDDELRIKRTHLKPAADASSQAASSQVVIPSLPLRSFKSQFSDTCVQALTYFSRRAIIEFRALPSAEAGANLADTQSAAAASSSVWLELRKYDATYRDIIGLLGRALATDPQRIQLHRPSRYNRAVPAKLRAAEPQHLAWTLNTLMADDHWHEASSPSPLLFYSHMRYSWTELEVAMPVVIHYFDQQLAETTFEAMIPRRGKFKELAAIAVKVRAQSGASAIRPVLCFGLDAQLIVTQFESNAPLTALRDCYKHDGKLTVLIREQCDLPCADVVWIHRYYPLDACYWRSAGVPFPMRIQDSDNVVEFRSRLQIRLGLDDARMAQIDVALLSSHEPVTPLAANALDIRPAQLLSAFEVRHAWVALGVNDRSAPPPPACKAFGAWKPTTADEAASMSRGPAGLGGDDDRRSIARLLLRDRAAADKAGLNALPTFTWHIPLQKWRDEKRDREYSPVFELEGESWRILLFPSGNPNHRVQGCVAAYLELRSNKALYSSAWHFKMQMVHPSEPSKGAWRESTHTFTDTEIDRGFNDLLIPATIAEYTHADGCVVLSTKAWAAAVSEEDD